MEVELGTEIPADRPLWLVANGWTYPTDSSINVAIGQGGLVRPNGLSLEAQNEAGRWVTIDADLGFPAGKNKTILVDLGRVVRGGSCPRAESPAEDQPRGLLGLACRRRWRCDAASLRNVAPSA